MVNYRARPNSDITDIFRWIKPSEKLLRQESYQQLNDPVTIAENFGINPVITWWSSYHFHKMIIIIPSELSYMVSIMSTYLREEWSVLGWLSTFKQLKKFTLGWLASQLISLNFKPQAQKAQNHDVCSADHLKLFFFIWKSKMIASSVKRSACQRW